MYELLQLLNCRVLPYKNISRDGNIAIETIKDLINSLEIKQNQKIIIVIYTVINH